MAKDTLFENGILDNDEGLLVDDEGNVIEDTSEEKEKDKKTDIPSDVDPNEILVDDFGNVITLDEDGNEIPNPDLDDEDDSEEDKDEDKDKEKTKSGTKGHPDSTIDSTSTFAPFAKVLKEEGILPDLEITEDTELNAEFFVKAVKEQVAKNEFKDLNEDAQNVLKIIRSGGDITSYLETYKKGQDADTNFAVISEDNAEAFLKEYWSARGLKDTEIDKIVDVAVINGKALEEAKSLETAYKELLTADKKKKVESTEAARKANQDSIAEQTTKYQALVNSKDEIIKGAKLDQSVKDQMFKLGTQAVLTKSGEKVTAIQKAFIEEPLETESKLNYLYIITNGFKDMGNLSYSKTAKTSALKDLDAAIKQEKETSKSGSSKKDNNSNKPSIISSNFS